MAIFNENYDINIFRENVYEIISNWGGYQPQEVCPDEENRNPAHNAGVVNVKCFINNICPFYKYPYKEDALVFSAETLSPVFMKIPDDIKNVISFSRGVDGIFFKPRWVYRHNYIYKNINCSNVRPSNANDALIYDLNKIAQSGENLLENFSSDYREISEIDKTTGSSIDSTEYTRYKDEQSWIISDGLYKNEDVVLSSSENVSLTEAATLGQQQVDQMFSYLNEECNRNTIWTYVAQPVPESEIHLKDLAFDYKKNYYSEHIKNISSPSVASDNTAKKIKIDTSFVQMPVLRNVLSNSNKGIHWRLIKKTPLFKGEDFFVRFYKMADKAVSFSDNLNFYPFPEYMKDFFPLDVARNDLVPVVRFEDNGNSLFSDDFSRPRNSAVAYPFPTSKDKEVPSEEISSWQKSMKTFSFFDQAYYMVELGIGSEEDHYFIIITQRSNPIFVHFVNGAGHATRSNGGSFSRRISEFDKISGSEILNGAWFEMTVRNHLGKIVIEFKGDKINDLDPWIINRNDLVYGTNSLGYPTLLEKQKLACVPRGRISLWGGNLKCGFLFGPLQYKDNNISMVYPPMDNNTVVKGESSRAPSEITEMSDAHFNNTPFSLPNGARHDILLSSTDTYIEELSKSVIPTGNSSLDMPLFTQDAQWYEEYRESSPNYGSGYKYGGFFYGENLRDNSDPVTSYDKLGLGRTSTISVRKNRFYIDPKSDLQHFDIVISMVCGDHVFTNQYWNGGSPPISAGVRNVVGFWDSSKIPDDAWLIEGCKTPIVSSLRVISREDGVRWEDGSLIGRDGLLFNKGTNGSPAQGISPYFVDASDHVMSFSDSWSATGFTEMEHTGTIQFLINQGFGLDNNISSYLESLQDKVFYIEIWAGYSRTCDDGGDFSSYSRQNGLYKMFTGFCHGGRIDREYGRSIMTSKIEDYSSILKSILFFNSPWFDGLKDINAIHEILQMAGLRDRGKYDPGSLVKAMSNRASVGDPRVFFPHFDGRYYKSEPYVLPSGYDKLNSPMFKFGDGDTFSSAISKISKRSAKVFYFDQFGIAHFENFQDIIEKNYMGEVSLMPLFAFSTNPEEFQGQLIFNKLERSFTTDSIYNHIKMMSNTWYGSLIIMDNINYSSLYNPESEGFIGFQKTFFQMESMFGSIAAIRAAVKKYSVMFRPKVQVKFETYGLPIRTNDIVSVNGEDVRVIKVDHNIDASKNLWWMSVDAERYQVNIGQLQM